MRRPLLLLLLAPLALPTASHASPVCAGVEAGVVGYDVPSPAYCMDTPLPVDCYDMGADLGSVGYLVVHACQPVP
jgi:hypothetical protein